LPKGVKAEKIFAAIVSRIIRIYGSLPLTFDMDRVKGTTVSKATSFVTNIESSPVTDIIANPSILGVLNLPNDSPASDVNRLHLSNATQVSIKENRVDITFQLIAVKCGFEKNDKIIVKNNVIKKKGSFCISSKAFAFMFSFVNVIYQS